MEAVYYIRKEDSMGNLSYLGGKVLRYFNSKEIYLFDDFQLGVEILKELRESDNVSLYQMYCLKGDLIDA